MIFPPPQLFEQVPIISFIVPVSKFWKIKGLINSLLLNYAFRRSKKSTSDEYILKVFSSLQLENQETTNCFFSYNMNFERVHEKPVVKSSKVFKMSCVF